VWSGATVKEEPVEIDEASVSSDGSVDLTASRSIAEDTWEEVSTSMTPLRVWSDLVKMQNGAYENVDHIAVHGSIKSQTGAGWNAAPAIDSVACCWNCVCTGVRWKISAEHADPDYIYAGFADYERPMPTRMPTGDGHLMDIRVEFRHGGNFAGSDPPYRVGSTGQDSDVLTYSSDWAGVSGQVGVAGQVPFFEIHLTETGADIYWDGKKRQTITRTTTGKYRFLAASYRLGSGIKDISYYVVPPVHRSSRSFTASGFLAAEVNGVYKPMTKAQLGQNSPRTIPWTN